MSALELVRDQSGTYVPCPDCGAHIDISTQDLEWTVRSPRDIGERLVVQLGTLPREELHVLLLNTRNTVVGQERVYQGNVSAALVRVGELFQAAVSRHVPRIILVHNHPSGDLSPSPDDLHLTAEAVAAGRLLDIQVLDHIVVAADGFASLRNSGISFGQSA